MPSTRRTVRDEADARELLDDLARSDLELRPFCRERGVDGRSLRSWQDSLILPDAPDDDRPRLVEMVQAPPRRPRSYRICVHDIWIEFPSDFEPAELARLVAAVRAC